MISLDPASPIWAVSCHNFSKLKDAVEGDGCRPDRDQWVNDLSFSMWTINEIEDGDAFNWLFGYNDWKKIQHNSTALSSSPEASPSPPPVGESPDQ